VATGAQVRLFRRGAARPVGVRWAAPIACAGSVQAVAKRQRCLRHRWIKSRQRRESAHPNNTAGGHNTTGGHRHTGPEPTARGGQQAPTAGGHNTAGRGGGRGAQHRGGHQHTRGPLPPANKGHVLPTHVLFLHVIIGYVSYPWVNCTGIRTLNPGFRGSPSAEALIRVNPNPDFRLCKSTRMNHCCLCVFCVGPLCGHPHLGSTLRVRVNLTGGGSPAVPSPLCGVP